MRTLFRFVFRDRKIIYNDFSASNQISVELLGQRNIDFKTLKIIAHTARTKKMFKMDEKHIGLARSKNLSSQGMYMSMFEGEDDNHIYDTIFINTQSTDRVEELSKLIGETLVSGRENLIQEVASILQEEYSLESF